MKTSQEDPARWAAAAARKVHDRYRQHRRRPTVRTTTADGEATIYYLTPDYNDPSGGVRTIYRHVDLLNAAGVPAIAAHQRSGFRCTWFDNSTRVSDVRSSPLGPRDILVIPETDGYVMPSPPLGVRHVVFNQNSHFTWNGGDDAVRHHYATSPDLMAVMTVSEHCSDLLRYAFPGLPVRRVHQSIDPSLFHPDGAERSRTIVYMPRRGREDAVQVLQLLLARGVLDDWEVLALDGLSYSAVAEALRRSTIFLSFAYQEGFGLPAAEAMACGNYVIGFDGFAGREFFRPEFSCPIGTGDVLAFARAVEEVIRLEERHPGWCAARGAEASRFVLDEYSPPREREDVIDFFAHMLDASR